MSIPGTASVSVQVETHHEDMIHDAQLDFYGKRLATCSSDRTVKVFDVIDPSAGEQRYHLVDTLRGHDGPVWQVAWAHPKFGSILASCSYDGKVFVWREASSVAGSTQRTGWEKIKEHTLHTASVNSIAWAPPELGPILACASSDGKLSVLTFNDDGTWEASLFPAHPIGANSVSWSPQTMHLPTTTVTAPVNSNNAAAPPIISQPPPTIASGGCDNQVNLYSLLPQTKAWTLVTSLLAHNDWVRSVSFAPSIGLARSYLASAGQDRCVFIWTSDTPGGEWSKVQLNGGAEGGKFPEVVWRVSWSVSGGVLAVCCGDGKVTLWKENLKGAWECVSEMQQ